jgi:RNA polymerase sigma-70 factor (ECF subfamily)
VDDRELAQRFPAGDETTVRAVYERYGRAVHTVAWSILRDAAQAADVTQATFVNAWKAAGRFDPTRELGPWLYAIARRTAIDEYRRRRRDRLTEPDGFERLDAAAAQGSEGIERTWEAWQVRLAVDDLPVEEQEVVRLAWFEGLTHPEIAARLDVPVGTVKSRSHRAHRRLSVALRHVRSANHAGPSVVDAGEPSQTDVAADPAATRGGNR